MEKDIFFKPAMQHENTGDILINKAIIDVLKKYGNLHVENRDKPSWFWSELDVESKQLCAVKSNADFYKKIENFIKNNKSKKDVFLVFPPGHTSRKGTKNFLIGMHGLTETYRLWKLKKLGVKIVRFGFSIGPFDILNSIGESIRTRVYHYYAVRDTKSLNLARKFGFKKPMLSPDLAWAYGNTSQPKEIVSGNEYVVLSFRSNTFGKIHNSEYLRPIIDRLHTLLMGAFGKNVKLVIAHQVLYDREASEEIFKSLRDTFSNIEIIQEKLLLDDSYNLYRNAKCVISNRLHVLLLAASANTLAFPLVKEIDNRKITSIYRDNDFKDLILDQDALVDENTAAIISVMNKKDDIIKSFHKVFSENKLKILERIEEAFS